MEEGRVLILIPARYASSRFPGKPLAPICGVSMIQRVYENCRQTGHDCVVVTDDQKIELHVRQFGGEVCRIDDDVSSGTERINLAYKRYYSEVNYDYIVNVQGDEPLLKESELSRLIQFHRESTFDICTLVRPMTGEGIADPNRVKAIMVPESGQCLYFSRSPIPFKRQKNDDWNLHIGVYCYTASALEQFCKAERSHYEMVEELEQLRALSLGMKIGAVTTDREMIGVDTPADIVKLEGVLRGKKND